MALSDAVRTPVEIPFHRAVRYGLRFIFDPLQAARDIYADCGPFALLTHPLLRKIRPDRFLLFTAGAPYNREVMADSSTWRMVTIFRGAPPDSAAQRLAGGIVRMTGSQHAHYRRTFDRPLRKLNVNKLGDEMARIADEEISTWPTGETIDLRQVCYRLIRTFSTELIFGGDRTRALPIANAISLLLQQGWTPGAIACPVNLPSTTYGKMLRGGEQLERCILEWAERKRGDGDDTNLLSIVVNAPDDEGNPHSDAAIVGHVTQLFSAAFETCQNVLVTTLMLLAQHPKVARDLLDELQGTLNGAEPTLDNIGSPPLLEAVIKESLRLLPPVPMSMRVATKGTTLMDFPVPEGGRVMLNPFLTNREPNLYPDPDSFKPERWATAKPTAFEFLAFGAGARACPGFFFAMNILKVSLASIVTRYRVALVPQAYINYWVRPLLTPSGDVPVVLTPQDGAFQSAPVQGNIHRLVRLAR